jgi:6-phosphofructokinase
MEHKMEKVEPQKILAIVITGAIAPGVNDITSSIVMCASLKNWKVIGFHDGFHQFLQLSTDELRKNQVVLTEEIAQSITNTAGSYIRTSRHGSVITKEEVEKICINIKGLGISYFCLISGHENLMMCHRIAKRFKNTDVQVLVVPKTIDNDIPLPNYQVTFGFTTAKHVGSRLVHNLTAETRSKPRYFIVETMGKKSGHLALGIAQGTNACLSVIPEDFGMKTISLKVICDYVQLALTKRLISGYDIGIVVVSESLVYSLDYESLTTLYPNGIIRNDQGDLDLDLADIGVYISKTVRDRFAKLGLLKFSPKKFGYELRGAKPTPTDSMIATQLGCGVVEGFLEHLNDCLVLWDDGRFLYRPVRGIIDPMTGKIPTRIVDVTSEEYRITKKYQCHVTKKDLKDEKFIAKAAEILNISPEKFKVEFGSLADLCVL